jgi:hypothetical protein
VSGSHRTSSIALTFHLSSMLSTHVNLNPKTELAEVEHRAVRREDGDSTAEELNRQKHSH